MMSDNDVAPKPDEMPTLVLLPGPQMTFEDVMRMFERLTGREPTAEEIEEARREWD